MDTRIYNIKSSRPLKGSAAFDYKDWIISISTVTGIYSEVLIWLADGSGEDVQVGSSGIDGILAAVEYIDNCERAGT